MELSKKVVVVTGAANGIGKALARRFAKDGAQVVCADIDMANATRVAAEIAGRAVLCDVASETSVKTLIDEVEATVGPIDLFCANAGVLTLGGLDVPDTDWDRTWKINLMSHVWAARHLVPLMLNRGSGSFLITASAAGVLNQPGAAPYAVSKHAAVGFAEWLALTYGDKGIGVSVLCPQAVRTDMIAGHENSVASVDGILAPEDVAETCVQALAENRFLVLPHPKVYNYMQMKAADYDRWIAGMQNLNQRFSKGN